MSKNYIKDTFDVLIGSETLKRLLWYPPRDTENFDPLSPLLPNISDDDELNWQVIEDRILLSYKSDDLVDSTPVCRIYLYLGDRNKTNVPIFENQEIVIDVVWHELFDNDLRIDSITKELDRLLLGKRITGWGKMEFVDGRMASAPKNYQCYRFIYSVGCMKK